jgi:tRNA dimethylallyltransferase
MYVRALIDGIFQGAGRDASVRDRLEREAENSGAAALHARLKRVDPPTALRIHPNDKRRIIRALEVYELSGRPISSFHNEWEPGGGGASGGNGISMSRNLGCAFAYAGLRRRKEDLASRIEGRVERMFREGAIEEVRKLLPRRGELPETMWQSLGLKEIIGSLEGRYGLDEAKRLLLKRTRAYAKRQYTWFNRDKRITWFDITPDESADRTAERIMSSMEVIRA